MLLVDDLCDFIQELFYVVYDGVCISVWIVYEIVSTVT